MKMIVNHVSMIIKRNDRIVRKVRNAYISELGKNKKKKIEIR